MAITQLQKEIIETLRVQPTINVKEEIRNRVTLLKNYLLKSKLNGFVLGISGGQDSTLAGKLCQLAVNELNEENGETNYKFVAVRLPYGVQKDENDCQMALKFIEPNEIVTLNIKEAVDKAVETYEKSTGRKMSDFVRGNKKARVRMEMQYDIAGDYGMLVVGTDHAAEAITGFFTKFGDGACDIAPLFGLNKRQGKILLKELNCPELLYLKTPTADLEDDKPQLPDEVSLGVTYENIDDYLEGKELEKAITDKIELHYTKTEHKRQGPVTLCDTWWK